MFNIQQPIFVTGIERSGITIIARILASCGVYTGEVTNMMENISVKSLMDEYYKGMKINPIAQYPMPEVDLLDIPEQWAEEVENRIFDNGDSNKVWFYKSPRILQTWLLWYLTYPNARWIFVRRRPADIVFSCIKTSYMKAYKDPVLLNQLGLQNEKEGWYWWIKQNNILLETFLSMVKVDYKEVWPDRMVHGDYTQIYSMLKWLNLEWNDSIVNMTQNILLKSKLKSNENNG